MHPLSVFISLPVLHISYKWSHTACGFFCVWPLSLSMGFQGSCMLQDESVPRSFLLVSDTPHFVSSFVRPQSPTVVQVCSISLPLQRFRAISLPLDMYRFTVSEGRCLFPFCRGVKRGESEQL